MCYQIETSSIRATTYAMGNYSLVSNKIQCQFENFYQFPEKLGSNGLKYKFSRFYNDWI